MLFFTIKMAAWLFFPKEGKGTKNFLANTKNLFAFLGGYDIMMEELC